MDNNTINNTAIQLTAGACCILRPVRPIWPVHGSYSAVYHMWPNGWMHQGETWRAGGPLPWPHCVKWGPSSPSPKGHSPPIFGPYLLLPNGCMDQDATLVWS